MSLKRKASLKLRVAEMNAAKLKRRSYDSSEGPSTDSPSENPSSSSMDEMLELPAPLESTYEGEFNSSEEEDDDDDDEDDEYMGETNQDDIKAIYKDWIDEMKRIDQQKMAMMLYDNYRDSFGLLNKCCTTSRDFFWNQ